MTRAADRDESFVQYVAARRPQLRRAAYLLTGDWSSAEDLVQVTLTKVYVAWRRVDRSSPEPYVRRTMLHAFLDERRRPSSRDLAYADVPDRAGPPAPSTEDADALRLALAALAPRQRATVVLRHWYGLSVEETADALGCSSGTVKSQTARALMALRAQLGHDLGGVEPLHDREAGASDPPPRGTASHATPV